MKKNIIVILLAVLLLLPIGCTSKVPTIDFSQRSAIFLAEHNQQETEKNLEKHEEEIKEVYHLLQEYRKEEEKEELVLDEALVAIAMVRAEEIAESGKFSHHRPNKEYFSSLYKEYGHTDGDVGENLAKEFESPADVMEAWKNSETHNMNMLQEKWTKVGIGIAEREDGKLIWVQEFME